MNNKRMIEKERNRKNMKKLRTIEDYQLNENNNNLKKEYNNYVKIHYL